MAKEQVEKLDKILTKIKQDKNDVAQLEIQKQQLEAEIQQLQQKRIMYKKMFEQYYSEETGEYHDPETGEIITDRVKSIDEKILNEITECDSQIKSLEFEIDKTKIAVQKVDREGKKTKESQKVRRSDKKELKDKEDKANKKVQYTKTKEKSTQDRVNTAKSTVQDDPTKKVDIGKAIKSGLYNENQSNSYAASLGLNTMGLKIPAGTNLEFVSQNKLILLSQIIAFAQNEQPIDYTSKDVQSLLNKPETAGILLKSVPESLAHIPVEVIYRDPKLFQIFDDAVNHKRKELLSTPQGELNPQNNLRALGVDPVKQKDEAEFYEEMLKMREIKEEELEHLENEEETELVRSISKTKSQHY